MPQPIPELEKANAELKKAQAVAAHATLQQWNMYGIPWRGRINLMLMCGLLVLFLFLIASTLWSEYKAQIKWNEILEKRPQLSQYPRPTYIFAVLPCLLLGLQVFYLANRLIKVYKGTKNFTELRTETGIFMVLGSVISAVLIVTFKVWSRFILELFLV